MLNPFLLSFYIVYKFTIFREVLMAEKNLKYVAKERYDALLKQKEAIEKELKPLKAYLENIGVLKKSTRGRRKINNIASPAQS
jgi:hypothetical protein